MSHMEDAEVALRLATKTLDRFKWGRSGVEHVPGISSYTGRYGAATVVVVAFEVPPDPLIKGPSTNRSYDGVLYLPPMIIRMPTSMAKKFYNKAASKLNGRKVPRGGGHDKT